MGINEGKLSPKSNKLFPLLSEHSNCETQHPFPVVRTHSFLKSTPPAPTQLCLGPLVVAWVWFLTFNALLQRWWMASYLDCSFLKGRIPVLSPASLIACAGPGEGVLSCCLMGKQFAAALESEISQLLDFTYSTIRQSPWIISIVSVVNTFNLFSILVSSFLKFIAHAPRLQ